MTLYVDSSALAKLFVEEPDSQTVRDLLRGKQWTAARHAYIEVRRALHRRLPPERLGPARARFQESWRDTEVVELDEATCDVAAELAETTGARTLDALHLAAARRAGGAELMFVTFDRRQAEAARSLGWAVLGV